MIHDTSIMHAFQCGDSVYFFDPDEGISSGYYTICAGPTPDKQSDDSIFMLASQDGTEIEALYVELSPVVGVQEAIANQGRSRQMSHEIITSTIIMLMAGLLLLGVGTGSLMQGASGAEGVFALGAAMMGLLLLLKSWRFVSMAHCLVTGHRAWWSALSRKASGA